MAIWPWRRRIWWLRPACGTNWDADARADLRLFAPQLGKKADVEGGAVRARRPLPRALPRRPSSCRLPPSPGRRRSRSSDGRAGRAGTPTSVVASGDAGARRGERGRRRACRPLPPPRTGIGEERGNMLRQRGAASRRRRDEQTPAARGVSMICLAKLQCLLETTTIAYPLLHCAREAKLDLPIQIAMSCWTQSKGYFLSHCHSHR
jgi:hypothetical protein